jgi:hypothetical protein
VERKLKNRIIQKIFLQKRKSAAGPRRKSRVAGAIRRAGDVPRIAKRPLKRQAEFARRCHPLHVETLLSMHEAAPSPML